MGDWPAKLAIQLPDYQITRLPDSLYGKPLERLAAVPAERELERTNQEVDWTGDDGRGQRSAEGRDRDGQDADER